MSSQQDLAANRDVFRSGGSFVLWWVWVVIAIVALIDLAIQAHNQKVLTGVTPPSGGERPTAGDEAHV